MSTVDSKPASKDLKSRLRYLRLEFEETGIRIRRYTMDPRLSQAGLVGKKNDKELSTECIDDTRKKLFEELRKEVDKAWDDWMELREKFLDSESLANAMNSVETEWLKLDRRIDLIQRELISERSTKAGILTVTWMVVALFLLGLFYLISHGVRGLDFSHFEPWPDWGPLKYAEVVCWSSFGVLCWLLFLASYYLKRRDFDSCYTTWYVSTALRAPFIAVILMMVILEFVEYYGEGTKLADYLLEEGNKYYFIVLVSFCLGLQSDSSSRIARELAESVVDFVRRVMGRFGRWLNSIVVDPKLPPE